MKLTSLILIGILTTGALTGHCVHWAFNGIDQSCTMCMDSELVVKNPREQVCVGDKSPIPHCKVTTMGSSNNNQCVHCKDGYALLGSSSSSYACVQYTNVTNAVTYSHAIINPTDATQMTYIGIPSSCGHGQVPVTSYSAGPPVVNIECKAADATAGDHVITVEKCLGYDMSVGTSSNPCKVCEDGYYPHLGYFLYKSAATAIDAHKTGGKAPACIKFPSNLVGCDMSNGIFGMGKYCSVCDYKKGYWSKGPVKTGNGWTTFQICTNGDRTVGESGLMRFALTSLAALLIFLNF